MIVQPDFFEHWKVISLKRALGGDELAPIYVLRLWAHCQTKKSGTLDVPGHAFPSICHYERDEPDKLLPALIDCGFVEPSEGGYVIHDWEDCNASLIQRWNAASRGGKKSAEIRRKQAEAKRSTSGREASVERESSESKARFDQKEAERQAEAKRRKQKEADEKNLAVRRLNAMFRRRDSTKWSDKEKKAMARIWPIEEADFALVEAYYTAENIPTDEDIRRRDLQTLLNNWPGEIDRARRWAEGKGSITKSAPAAKRPLSTWEIKERLNHCRERRREITNPGGCAFSQELNSAQQKRVGELTGEIRMLEARLETLEQSA